MCWELVFYLCVVDAGREALSKQKRRKEEGRG